MGDNSWLKSDNWPPCIQGLLNFRLDYKARVWNLLRLFVFFHDLIIRLIVSILSINLLFLFLRDCRFFNCKLKRFFIVDLILKIVDRIDLNVHFEDLIIWHLTWNLNCRRRAINLTRRILVTLHRSLPPKCQEFPHFPLHRSRDSKCPLLKFYQPLCRVNSFLKQTRY